MLKHDLHLEFGYQWLTHDPSGGVGLDEELKNRGRHEP